MKNSQPSNQKTLQWLYRELVLPLLTGRRNRFSTPQRGTLSHGRPEKWLCPIQSQGFFPFCFPAQNGHSTQ
jgi:hypothetical protein